MLKLLNMHVEGFCSISTLDIRFDQKQTILIKAPNGFGKSTIFSALVWALYGKPIKKASSILTWPKVRPKDYAGAMVQVSFQNNENIYTVIRCSSYTKDLLDGSKGKDRLLFIKDAEISDVKSKVQLQHSIDEAIGFSQVAFTSSIMFGQGLDRVIRESNSDKKKLFEEIFDLNYLDNARSISREYLNSLNIKLAEAKSNLNGLESEMENNIDTYKDLKSQEDSQKEHRKELKTREKALLDKKSEAEAKLGKPYNKKVSHVQDKIMELQKEYNKAKSVSDVPMRDFITQIYSLMEQKKYSQAMKSLSTLKDSFIRMDDIHSEIGTLIKRKEEYMLKHQQYMKYKQILAGIEENLESLKSQIIKLKESSSKSLSDKYKDKIIKLREDIAQAREELKGIQSEVDDYNWLLDDPLSNNGIKAYLFDSSLEIINQELDKYYDILGFHISFEIDLQTTRKEFCTLIERDGCIIDYEELSGGEKQLVDISMAFAMNQALTLSRGINIAFLDELFESLSDNNIDLVVQLVKEVYRDKTLFLISHHDSLPFSNAKILEVEKRNGLSYYHGL